MLALFLIAGLHTFAQSSSTDYAWRLDEAEYTYYSEYMPEYGDTVYDKQLVRYVYGDSSFYTMTFPEVEILKDTIDISSGITKMVYNHLGENGKHRETKYYIRLRGSSPNVIRFMDSIPWDESVFDTLHVRHPQYDEYAYDTYRNVYDADGNLLRTIRNYDYTHYYIDSDSLLKVLDYYQQNNLTLGIVDVQWMFDSVPYEASKRYVSRQTDTEGWLWEYENISYYNESYLSPVWLLKKTTHTGYTGHLLTLSESIDETPDTRGTYMNLPKRITKSTRYNTLGVKTGYCELTQRWTVDSVPTVYYLFDQTFVAEQQTQSRTEEHTYADGILTKNVITTIDYLSADTVRRLTQTYVYTTDSANVRHTQLTSVLRIYLNTVDQMLYTKTTVNTDGEEQLIHEEQWLIEATEQGIKRHLLFQDKFNEVVYPIYITDTNNYTFKIGQYTIQYETHMYYRYDERFRIILECDSSQYVKQYLDSVEWQGHRYEAGLYRPQWGTFSRKEYEYDADGSVVSERQYLPFLGNAWFLTSETRKTDDYTYSMTVNTNDSTRTTSKRYTNGWDSESTKDTLDRTTMTWQLKNDNQYKVTFDLRGTPISATSFSVNEKGDQDNYYYIFHKWDEQRQLYKRQLVAWSMTPSDGETVYHSFNSDGTYEYFARDGRRLGMFSNTYYTDFGYDDLDTLPKNYRYVMDIYGVLDQPHFDELGRIDTLYRYAYYRYWQLFEYIVYTYVPEGNQTDVSKKQIYGIASSYDTYRIDIYERQDYVDYKAYDYHRELSKLDTVPHVFDLRGTKAFTNTYSTYDDHGWLINTRTYKDGSITPVVQYHNLLTYDDTGRILTHVAFKDSVPDTRRCNFYSPLTGELVAYSTWSGYNNADSTFAKYAFTNLGEHTYDADGRLLTYTAYIASADSMSLVPSERSEYTYLADDTDWLRCDQYVWQDSLWQCSNPLYRGLGLHTVAFDDNGNIITRSKRKLTCEGLSDAEIWNYTYGSPLDVYDVLMPQAYGVMEQNIAELFNYESLLARPLTADYSKHPQSFKSVYNVRIHYTPLREEVLLFNTPVTVDVRIEDSDEITEPQQGGQPAQQDTVAVFTWPRVDGATGYTLTVWRNAEMTEKFCTLTFNAYGTLLVADFSRAPKRSALNSRSTADRPSFSSQLSFTVTGLTPNTQYWFTITALDGSTVLDTQDGTFRTALVPTDDVSTMLGGSDAPRKFLRNGHIYIRHGGKIYTIQGQLKK